MAIDFSKKVAGVPVVYLAGGAVAIFAVVAYRMKPAPEGDSGDAAGTAEDAVLDESGLADGSNPYAGYNGNGTVIVAPTPPPVAPEPDKPDTNDEWIRDGAEWLVAEKDVSGAAAYTALSKFVEGKSRSTLEAQWVEWTIKEKGLPPDPFADTPLPSTPTPAPPTPTGYRGYGWVKADGRTSGAQYAAKYGIAVTLFYTFNPNQPRVPRTGVWLKVRANSNPLTGYAGK